MHVCLISETKLQNHISGVMVSLLTLSTIDCTFKTRSGLTKDFKIGICCFFAKHTALRRKKKEWLAGNQDNVQRHFYLQTVVPLSQYYNLVQKGHHHHLIVCNLFSSCYSLKIAQLALNDNRIFVVNFIFSSYSKLTHSS